MALRCLLMKNVLPEKAAWWFRYTTMTRGITAVRKIWKPSCGVTTVWIWLIIMASRRWTIRSGAIRHIWMSSSRSFTISLLPTISRLLSASTAALTNPLHMQISADSSRVTVHTLTAMLPERQRLLAWFQYTGITASTAYMVLVCSTGIPMNRHSRRLFPPFWRQ